MKLPIRRFALAAMCSLAFTSAAVGAPSKFVRQATPIPGEYIVVLAANIPDTAVPGVVEGLAKGYNVEVVRIWSDAIKAFLMKSSEPAAQAIAEDPRVHYVETNAFVNMHELSGTVNTWDTRPNPDAYLWHLDRLDELSYDQRDSTYNMCSDASNVYVYLIDTGVMTNHQEISSSIVASLDFTAPRNLDGSVATDATNGCSAQAYKAKHWHGTATASVVAGSVIGAARAKVVSLKVYDCNTGAIATSTLIDAVNWIATMSNPYRSYPAVVNHSGFVPKWDSPLSVYGDAVSNLVAIRNLPFFTSADNWSADACQFAPNHLAYTNYDSSGFVFVTGGSAMQNSGTTNPDGSVHYIDVRYQKFESNGFTPLIGQESGSSNGSCVSAFAPGVDIWVAQFDSNRNPAYGRQTGTSFSTVLAAALGARYIQTYRAQYGQTPSYRNVYNFLLSNAVTSLSWTNTPRYWACIHPDDWRLHSYSLTQPISCPSGYSGPWEFPATSNSSNARMLYWDEGVCP
ncbi:MAG: S8 family serine peptidase [Thermoanaerobaculia bacterium]|nr:S8 family serine peptidase [Thermoanaerobaculia bacterium]